MGRERQGARIAACVVVERDNHKPILLGAGGMHMKRIATEARQDIAKLLDKTVHLEVYIKVRKGWSDRARCAIWVIVNGRLASRTARIHAARHGVA